MASLVAQIVKRLPKMWETQVKSLGWRDLLEKELATHSSICVQLFATLWTVACQAPVSMGFPRQEYWSGVLCPPPGDLPDPGIEPASFTTPALVGRFFTCSATWEVQSFIQVPAQNTSSF